MAKTKRRGTSAQVRRRKGLKAGTIKKPRTKAARQKAFFGL